MSVRSPVIPSNAINHQVSTNNPPPQITPHVSANDLMLSLICDTPLMPSVGLPSCETPCSALIHLRQVHCRAWDGRGGMVSFGRFGQWYMPCPEASATPKQLLARLGTLSLLCSPRLPLAWRAFAGGADAPTRCFSAKTIPSIPTCTVGRTCSRRHDTCLTAVSEVTQPRRASTGLGRIRRAQGTWGSRGGRQWALRRRVGMSVSHRVIAYDVNGPADPGMHCDTDVGRARR